MASIVYRGVAWPPMLLLVHVVATYKGNKLMRHMFCKKTLATVSLFSYFWSSRMQGDMNKGRALPNIMDTRNI